MRSYEAGMLRAWCMRQHVTPTWLPLTVNENA